ncbi:MAG: non-reducing end alpha-L-arabinofuranosidase family hydrolase, partial [Gemmatales bacterium]|nr:non-reducing end alpha-L-arabinofuranosidase family hydrolase [Gemmatales bacterium]MDW8176153.1 non-reducing end alpha-L-arabinofuranosidase family hydrolase [Gemmatales bacterium]
MKSQRHRWGIGSVVSTVSIIVLGWTCNSAPGQLPQKFFWRASPPLIEPQPVNQDHVYAFKDPSVVFYEGRWHLFCTVRGRQRSHGIAYFNFPDWDKAGQARPVMLPNHDGFFCAPQVFYFRPHQRWYLICQAADKNWTPNYGPAFATSPRLDDPPSWSRLTPLQVTKPAAAHGWLDFWVICDEQYAYLFFTSLDGKMWRSRTALAQFPQGWSPPVLALQGDIFEASHTYKILGHNLYLTIIEAQNGPGWRYYKA